MSQQRLLFDPPGARWVERIWERIDPGTRREVLCVLAEMARRSLVPRPGPKMEVTDES